ncbi:transposase, partial [Clostridium gasigenes]
VLDDTPQQVNVLKIDPISKALDIYSYNNDTPVNEDGLIIIYDNKSRNLDNSQYKRQSENRKIKQQLIRSIQSRWMEIEPQSIKLIADEFSIGVLTAKKYIQMSEEDIKLLDQPTNYKKRKTVADDYLNIIYKMLADKIEPAIILAYIIKMGYTGNIRTIQTYIELFAKNNFNYKLQINWAYKKEYPKDITLIKRHKVLSYILRKDSEETKGDGLEKHIEAIKKRYDIVNVLKNAYYSFYTTLMGNDPNQLETFINDYESSPIKGFIDGIKKDIAPVKNAISHSESSGFVEGNNNKFKLIKRILYGRANLVNLFKKCYVTFQVKCKDFSLQKLIKTNALN